RLCEELFLTRKAKEQDDNLLFVRERMLRSEEDLAGLLTHYAQVHRGRRVEDDETSPFGALLKLSGIARVENGRLRVRNRIYEGVFDREWVAKNMPDAEVRRQRAAYQRGLLRAGAVAVVIIAAIVSLAFIAVKQRNRADEQRARAEQQEETNRRNLYAAEMNLAGQAWEDAGIPRMMDLLNNHVPKPGQEDLRGFEWYYLWGLGNGELRSIRHGNLNTTAAFFPDNRRLVTGGDDRVVRVWDVVTGQQLMSLSGHTDNILSVAVSPDGQTLASASYDQTAKLWNAVTSQEMATLRGHTAALWSVAFSPDGRKLATASEDETVRLWDVASGRELVTLAHPKMVTIVAFSPDNKTVATGCIDGIVRLWNAATGKEAQAFKGNAEQAFKGINAPSNSLAFAPDGATLVTGTTLGWIGFWDITTGKIITATGLTGSQQPRQKVIEISSAVSSLSYSPNGKTLAVASFDRTVKLYSVATLILLKTFRGHGLGVNSVEFSHNGRLLATGGGGVVKLWDVETSQDSGLNTQTAIREVEFSPAGNYLASNGVEGAKLWDVKTWEEIRSFHGHTDFITRIMFSPDGQRLATGSNDKTAKVWDVATGQEIVTLRGHTLIANSFAFSPDSKRLAIACLDNIIRVCDAGAGREIITLSGHTKLVNGMAFSSDGRRLATGSDDNTAKIWDAITYQEIATFNHRGPVYEVAFSPDSKNLGTACGDGLAQMWDLSTGKVSRIFKGHVGEVQDLIFFPDGRRLATLASDKTVKLWDVETGQQLLSRRFRRLGMNISVSPDGKVLAMSGDVSGALWFAGDPAASAESKLARLRELTMGK
ncbi:MAG: WD40 repeat domain-containing protein, partial [Acidobacteria bacterium]|nr:WD40 repeat domain-containing protein [Acidobacteriota bacterium]